MPQKVYVVVSQKGGVGKTSTAVSLAVAFAKEGHKVLLADMDALQKTAVDWYESRAQKFENLSVKAFRSIQDLAKISKGFDIVIADGAPHASAVTVELAEVADRIIIPSSSSLFDLRPSARLAFELIDRGISKRRIGFALVKITTAAEAKSAHQAIEDEGLQVLGMLKASTGYAQALDAGRSLQEAAHPSLREHAQKFIDALR